MNDDNAKQIWKLIQKTGDELIGKLPPHPSHPRAICAYGFLPFG